MDQRDVRAAWEKFVDLYTPLLFAWARRLDLPSHESADLVQDIFAVLVEKLPSFAYDESRSFRAWLKTVLLNLGRYVAAILCREHQHLPDVQHRRVKGVRLWSAQDAPIQTDGDPAGTLPVTVEVAPGALKLLVPG